MIGKNKNQKLSALGYLGWTVAGAVLFFLAVFLVISVVVPHPHLLAHRVDGKVSIDSEITLNFDLPVSRQLQVALTPETIGEVQYNNTILGKHLVRSFVFRPEVNWLPDTTYEIRVSNIKSALPSFRSPNEVVYTFTTESAPSIKKVTPETGRVIATGTVFRVELDKPNDRQVEYEFRFTPALEVTSENNEDKTVYTVTPTSPLSQGVKYSLEIFKKDTRYLFDTQTIAKQGEPESTWQGNWQVQEATGIVSFMPSGGVVPLNSQINIVFSDNVDLDSLKDNVTIEPSLSGSWSTADNKTFNFTPSSLAQDTTYTVKLKSGLRAKNGSFLAADSIHTFTTQGPLKILNSSPIDGSSGFGVDSDLVITFDQAVVRQSAESKFSISPAVEGSFSWTDNSLKFQPKNSLAYNTKYAITLAAGILSDGGLDSTTAQTVSFTTELSVTKLSVPFHRQEHNLSCEVATLVMALKYRGVNITEATLIKAIGFDPTPKKNGVWGDPYQAFVGDIDGHQPSTGYGVYWGPIATAASKYRSARILTGGKLSDITAEIKKGNPVIFWGTAGTGKRIDWRTSGGTTIMAVNGEHTRVVIGFIGPADNPTKIITLDPLFGEKYFTPESFMSNWSVLGYNGVVIE